jgi:hypothetical protein
MQIRRPILVSALLAAAPLALLAQSVPVKTLAKPDAEFSEPFTLVNSVRELSNGQLVVADSRDKTLQLISFDGGAKKIGREGSGPGEYGMPSRALPGAGDTTFVYDPLNSRFLVVDPNGKPVTTFALGGETDGGARLIQAPQAVDSRGRFYFRGSPFVAAATFGPNGPERADSIALYRYDRATKKYDTLAWIPNTMQTSGSAARTSGGQTVRMMAMTPPFAAADQWTVTPDGRLAIVRGEDYHVDWYQNGRKVSGPPIPFEKIKVTEADKTEWRAGRGRGGTTMNVAIGGVRRGSGGAPGAASAAERTAQTLSAGSMQEPEWPEFKGPFSTVAAAPDGKLWVLRHGKAGDAPTFDIIDASGRPTMKVVLQKGSRLVGFGNGTVYVVRLDEDDLQYLQRFRI